MAAALRLAWPGSGWLRERCVQQAAGPADRRPAVLRALVSAGSLAAWLACGAAGPAAAQEAPEVKVKAAYLAKFPAFVDWPAEAFSGPAAAYVIGVLGADDVLAELQLAPGSRRVLGRPVVAERVNPGDSPANLHLLYVGRAANVQAVASALGRQPVLLVTDDPAGIGSAPTAGPAAINFVRVDGKLRFEASPRAAERVGLKLSARLLAVAERVVGP